jgi:flagellar assembly protein FliH
MKSSPERIHFRGPLREVRLSASFASEEQRQQQLLREESALERGRREAEAGLRQQMLQQRTELLDLQNGVFRSLSQMLPQLSQECENVLIELAVQAAEKVVAGLSISVEMVEVAVREALERVQAAGTITVRLHAEDVELLKRANSPLLLDQIGGERVRIEPGEGISRGGCLIETSFGIIDARREKKFQMLRRSLFPE